ncbi:hypothetical protein MVLG_04333 [Microbotryum lychnidis-dioicae p1A1 Lamole]|uniref:G-patch domain-containing protein n=1 Tax=Microbotryum lychnidis-dioicae (strain p1A1 Lamole / MvSl-1064) TaxID=683840 RepID=U5HAW8_USTV1|nr:hypothetical protein MVLG_04333 [Microbotryum lychnidis-dioicae p1A1 Lamole]|eukprot:KDE05302.1 hypothetical protein MVLG_04333 [Microbotryum lychnidis-dioicae p1A1 Lamole]
MSSTFFTSPIASTSSSTASSNSLEDPPPSISNSSSSQLTSSSVAHFSAQATTTTTPSNPTPKVIIPFRAFSPPKWIFSHPSTSTQTGDDDIQPPTVANSSTSFYDPHRSIRGEVEEHYRERFPAYAPKRPGIRFVKATMPVLNGREVGGEDSSVVVEANQSRGEIAQVSKGIQVRGLYENLVGINAPPRLVEKLDSVRKPSRISSSPSRESKLVDLDLTSDQYDSDSDSVSDENEDIIILDPLTRLPEPKLLPNPLPRTKRARPNAPLHRAIHELLPSQPLGDPIAPQDQVQTQGIVPLVPPTYYAIPSTNIGWRILQRQGWKEGGSLGSVQQGEGGGSEQGRGLKVPLKASDKFDRKGLGNKLKGDVEEGALKEWKKEKERKRRDLVEVEKRGKGSREIEMRQRQEMKDRKELLAYMNRD